ncbi:probable ubiquitin-conjugating enzyme E2 24 [Olea europaea var. sylvestris]|uniref:probable ubiquitin-conjugating enzyme E2 24 n=1 Tax=Olea europaea var. sylvestris TaxID=158386 RepID=UPI000C1D634A|nr:probable ubiquitin-conjugating enzyme E2 24 [Olea europaea var. sylvestris]
MASGSGSEENQATNEEFKHFDIVQEASDHHYRNSEQSKSFSKVNSFAHRKIMREWRSLEKDLPESIYVQVYETRIDLLRAVIIGAEGTPYHNGLFFFDICLPSDYPFRPPKVYYHSHGLNLNPNLYADGTVCLSLLNTWYGAKTEKWTQNSTILQVLVSIQALVLNDRPYFNEPSRERGKNRNCPKWIKNVVTYNEKVFILSCKTMLYTMQNPPKNFEIFVIEHFCKRADSILANVMAYQDFFLVVGASEIKASITFKWNLRRMHSKLKRVFDTISKPNINNSEKIENVKKEMKPHMFKIDFIVPAFLVLLACALPFWVMFMLS